MIKTALGKFGKYTARWRSLRMRDKAVFLRACFALVVIKIGLSFLPFAVFRSLFNRFTKTAHSETLPQRDIDAAIWAVDTAANLLPLRLLCLPRALALKYLLRHVNALTLEIGVELNSDKSFEAHAWVERNGTVLIGDWPDSVRYQRLWVWN